MLGGLCQRYAVYKVKWLLVCQCMYWLECYWCCWQVTTLQLTCEASASSHLYSFCIWWLSPSVVSWHAMSTHCHSILHRLVSVTATQTTHTHTHTHTHTKWYHHTHSVTVTEWWTHVVVVICCRTFHLHWWASIWPDLHCSHWEKIASTGEHTPVCLSLCHFYCYCCCCCCCCLLCCF